jgi:hypothetical protein
MVVDLSVSGCGWRIRYPPAGTFVLARGRTQVTAPGRRRYALSTLINRPVGLLI